MKESNEIWIGDYVLIEKDYADKFWIYKDGGEGMALSEELLKELESVIAEFFKKHM